MHGIRLTCVTGKCSEQLPQNLQGTTGKRVQLYNQDGVINAKQVGNAAVKDRQHALTWNLNLLKGWGRLVSPVISYTNLPQDTSSKTMLQVCWPSVKGRNAPFSVSSALALMRILCLSMPNGLGNILCFEAVLASLASCFGFFCTLQKLS